MQWNNKSPALVIDACLVLVFPVNNELKINYGSLQRAIPMSAPYILYQSSDNNFVLRRHIKMC